MVECRKCGAFYSPLLSALKVGLYERKEANFEHEVIEAVIDTNYRRLIKGRSIDISLGGIHNLVVGSDIDQAYQEPVPLDGLSGIMADETGLKQYKGRKGELRTVIGITTAGRVELHCSPKTGPRDMLEFPEHEKEDSDEKYAVQ